MIPADSNPISTNVRSGRWSATYRGTNGALTTLVGRGNTVGENMEGLHMSPPVAARKRGRGLGARKRRMREARALRAANMKR